ncbi:MAG TPA: sensor histidine kinase [Longimicrobiales bacterium]|nr:sensor histidine kinase [Longimicrobiales bacterium]
MRLADFILSNREPILAEWIAFARTCEPASTSMDLEALRDHADEMLTVIAADLKTPQGQEEQSEKSMGQGEPEDPAVTTAAEAHGADRADSGFTVEQMASEYRALRASVIRLWTKQKGALVPEDVEDLTRFNEAIDQALAESITQFSQDLQQSKEIFLAILGHDLRTPLGAIYTSATFMLDLKELKEPHLTLTQRIARSAARTTQMVGDLLDFTRSRLGGGIPVVRARMNLGRVVRDVVDEVSGAYPDRTITVDTRKDETGEWDEARVSQAIGNLIGNAVQHSAPGTTVDVDVQGDAKCVSIAIHNRGATIAPGQLNGIFNPMKAKEWPRSTSASGPVGNLGLGLYIAERIVSAHDGRIEVKSSDDEGTTFTVYLPRHGSRKLEKEQRAGM